jgi:hypothetical protein
MRVLRSRRVYAAEKSQRLSHRRDLRVRGVFPALYQHATRGFVAAAVSQVFGHSGHRACHQSPLTTHKSRSPTPVLNFEPGS